MSRYSIYTHRENAQAFHQFQGAMILLGSMMFLLGMLLLHYEMIVLGSGLIVMAACLSVCDMNNPYHTDNYYGRSEDQLERAEVEESE